jgi:hypothetical protein
MPMVATSISATPTMDSGGDALPSITSNDVVEIGLLLPMNWANRLFELSQKRHESVAQILRGIIGNALHEVTTSA